MIGFALGYTYIDSSKTGKATPHNSWGGPNCGDANWPDYVAPTGGVVALGSYDSGIHCGSCIEVAGPLGVAIIKVMDNCAQGCGTNGLDIAQNTFTQLITLSTGEYMSCWTAIECPPSFVSGNVQYLFPERNYYYFSIYIRNHKIPVSKLEIEISSAWKDVPRQDSNKFALGSINFAAPFRIRLTAADGQQIIDTIQDTDYTTNNIFTSSTQFGSWQGSVGTCTCAASFNSSSQICSGQTTGTPAPASTTGSQSTTGHLAPAPTGTGSPAPTGTGSPAPSGGTTADTTSSESPRASTTLSLFAMSLLVMFLLGLFL